MSNPEQSVSTGEPAPEPGAAAALDRLLAARYSCRAFAPDPVPDAVLERILLAARRAPSWCNSQAWHVHLVSGRRTHEFAEHLRRWVAEHPMAPDIPAPREYRGAYAERRRAAGHALYAALGIDRADHAARGAQMLRNFEFFGAPHVAVVTTPEALGPYGAVDCGGYVQTLLLAATARGVDSCAQAALALYSDGVRDFLGLPTDRHVVCGVALGYADPGHPANALRTERAGLAESVTHVR